MASEREPFLLIMRLPGNGRMIGCSIHILPVYYLLVSYIFVLSKMLQGAKKIEYRFMKKKRNDEKPLAQFQIRKPEVDEQTIKKSWDSIVQKINGEQPKKKR